MKSAIKQQVRFDRREFLVMASAIGGGLGIGLVSPARALEQIGKHPWLDGVTGDEINAWIVIAPDDITTIRIAQSEQGQGVMTSNAMMVCEELECDWSKVRVEYADANRHFRDHEVYGHMGTDSSSSFRLGRVPLQQAGASARERLKLAAAQEWGVPVETVTTKNSVITHAPTGRTLRYGEVAAKAATVTLPQEPAIKTHDQYTFIGTPMKRLEIPLKVTGQAIFGMDLILPEMLYAAVKVSPTIGGKLKSFDFDAVKNRSGIHSVVALANLGKTPRDHYEVPDGVAIVADNWWRAKRAVEMMPVEWEEGPEAKLSSGDVSLAYRAMLDAPGNAISESGDADAVLSHAGKVVEGVYEVPRKAHATMEPINCTAQVTADRVDVWKGTSDPTWAMKIASKQAGLPLSNTYFHNCYAGGGFGGRNERGDVAQAVEIAKTLGGRPVKLIWSREDDMRMDILAPTSVARFRSALGSDGLPTATVLSVVSDHYPDADAVIGPQMTAKSDPQSARGLSELPYKIPNLRVEMHHPQTFMPGCYWRGSGAVNNVFHQECFIDELAHAAGQDPYRYRRKLVEANTTFLDREFGGGPANRAAWLKVLDTVAEKSGWGTPLPKGSGRGMAIDDRRTPKPRGCTVTAIVLQVTVSETGQLTLDRADVAMDIGYTTVNPLIVVSEIHGQIPWYFGAAMWQDIVITNGKITQRNFDTYRMPTMRDFPKEFGVHLVNTDKWNYGVGDEVTMVAPALCNAIFAATGKRIRSLPIQKHDLTWA
jgi:isoquinoline 1-oxidoreductase beta subunit